MCGICGFISKEKHNRQVIKEMTATMNHRGPDDSGFHEVLANDFYGAFGQTRLAIIDLSADGHQPMHYHHFSIVFNGEVYNFKEIREELIKLGHSFKSQSDTEVVLHSFAEWGVSCVNKFIGMFTFVIFDKQRNKLFCCRDRAGVKPFFYYKKDKTFLFSSELKALHQHPEFEKDIDLFAVNQYFQYGYVPSPNCIFKNTFKLNPGNWLEYDIEKNEINIETYWNIFDVYAQPVLNISYAEAKIQLLELFKSAFNYRMIADVPVGVFLSGGFDSTLVTAILQSTSAKKIKTFTIGFNQANNEAPYAKKIAKHLGTDHIEYYCTEKEALAIIPDLPYYYDEPFADSSAIPTKLVSQLAKKEVTVALSADGGDEVFVGYNRYPSLVRHIKKHNRIPEGLKQNAARILNLAKKIIPEGRDFFRHKIDVFSQSLLFDPVKGAAFLLNGIESSPKHLTGALLPSLEKSSLNFESDLDYSKITDPFNAALAFDYLMYLQNDILVKVDRAGMSVSLENREPLLDHRIVEFAAQLPANYKYDGITTKRILKDIVYEFVPRELMDRPKTGFSIPLRHWLKNDLNGMLKETLNFKDLENQGVLNPRFVEETLKNFDNNKFQNADFIWKVFQFQLWYNRWIK